MTKVTRRNVVKGLAASMAVGGGLAAVNGAAAQTETKVIYGDSLYPPTTCDGTVSKKWLFVIQPDPGPDVTSIDVTFNYTDTITVSRNYPANNRAVFRTGAYLDAVPTQLTAVVPADFVPTSFRTGSGPCGNAIPEPPVTPTYTVSGTILQHGNGKPVAGATVCLQELDVCTTTDAEGFFAFAGVEDGTYTITSNADVYKPLTTQVTVAGDNVYLDLTQYRGGGRN